MLPKVPTLASVDSGVSRAAASSPPAAIGTPTSLTSSPLSSSTSTTSYSVNTTATAPASSRVLLAAGWWSSSSPTVTVSGGGLVWVALTPIQGTNYTVGVWTADAPSGLASGTALSIGTSVAAAGMMAAAFYCTGMATGTSPGDGSQGTISASGSSWSSGAMTATTKANDLLIGVGFGDGDSSNSSTATGTLSAELFDFVNATTGWSLTVTYNVATATGAYTAAGTWLHSNSFGNVGYIAAVKGAA